MQNQVGVTLNVVTKLPASKKYILQQRDKMVRFYFNFGSQENPVALGWRSCKCSLVPWCELYRKVTNLFESWTHCQPKRVFEAAYILMNCRCTCGVLCGGVL